MQRPLLCHRNQVDAQILMSAWAEGMHVLWHVCPPKCFMAVQDPGVPAGSPEWWGGGLGLGGGMGSVVLVHTLSKPPFQADLSAPVDADLVPCLVGTRLSWPVAAAGLILICHRGTNVPLPWRALDNLHGMQHRLCQGHCITPWRCTLDSQFPFSKIPNKFWHKTADIYEVWTEFSLIIFWASWNSFVFLWSSLHVSPTCGRTSRVIWL